MLEATDPTRTSTVPDVTQNLASRLVRDIYRRGLRPGDRYLTDKQAAELLQVSQVSAHRAMRHLAEQELVVRRRRSGTFIGPKAERSFSSTLHCVHYLMPSQMKNDYPLLSVLEGVRSELPGTQIQLNFLPVGEPLRFLRQLLEHAVDSGVMTAIVVASSTREMLEFLSGTDLPVLVGGHVEPDIDLPWIDRDQGQIGRLLAGYLLQRGHRRIALVMRDLWAPGDNIMADGVSTTLSSTGASLTVRGTPPKKELIGSIIRDMLDCPDRPTGLICRSEAQAICAAEISEQMGLPLGNGVDIVAANIPSSSTQSQWGFPHASFDPIALGARQGRMIAQLSGGQRPDPYYYEIPVSLETPADCPAASRAPNGVIS